MLGLGPFCDDFIIAQDVVTKWCEILSRKLNKSLRCPSMDDSEHLVTPSIPRIRTSSASPCYILADDAQSMVIGPEYGDSRGCKLDRQLVGSQKLPDVRTRSTSNAVD